jgi:hypothetical protein
MSKQTKHFAITGYDCSAARQLVKELNAAHQEYGTVEKLQQELQDDIGKSLKKTSFSDVAGLNSLTLKRAQLDLCPNKLAQLEEQITEYKQRAYSEFTRARGAVGKLFTMERTKIREEILKTIRPICLSDKEAETIVEQFERYKTVDDAAERWIYRMANEATNLENAIAVLDRFESKGTVMPESKN